jgi:hypothetical protein
MSFVHVSDTDMKLLTVPGKCGNQQPNSPPIYLIQLRGVLTK